MSATDKREKRPLSRARAHQLESKRERAYVRAPELRSPSFEDAAEPRRPVLSGIQRALLSIFAVPGAKVFPQETGLPFTYNRNLQSALPVPLQEQRSKARTIAIVIDFPYHTIDVF